MSDANYILTPVGRMVSGHPFEPIHTDYEGRPLTDRNNQPRTEFFIGLAVPKDSPEWPNFWAFVYQVGAAGFPGGQYQQPTFAWKISDGDDPKFAGREGYAGHWIIKMTNGFQPKVYQQQGGSYVELVDKGAIKRGDYIRVNVQVAPNGNQQKPGVYLNPSMVELCGYGPEIMTGPDASQVFGQAPAPTLPPGASQTPVAGTAPMPAAPGHGGGGAVPGPGSAPGQGVPAAPQQPAAPQAPAPGATPPGAPAAAPAPAPAPSAPAAPTAPAAPGGPVPAPGFVNGPGQ